VKTLIRILINNITNAIKNMLRTYQELKSEETRYNIEALK
jgi:hypothetical protein